MLSFQKSKDNWENYIVNHQISEDTRREISKSWKRCRNLGTDPYGGIGPEVSGKELDSRIKVKEELLSIARPIMDSVYEIIKDTVYSVVITDQDGIILDALITDPIRIKSQDLNFLPGSKWDEKSVGTNAIGTALAIDQPIQVVGAEHYCITHHDWTCSAAPIHDSRGNIIGCLDLSGRVQDVHIHTFGIAVSAAKSIEKQMKILETYKLMDTVFESMLDGLMIIDEEYQIKNVNNKFASIFMLNTEEVYKLNVKDILKDVDVENTVFRKKKHVRYTDCSLTVKNNRIDCMLNIFPIEFDHNVIGAGLIIRESKQVRKEVNQIVGFKANYQFENIITQDKKMLEIISFAKKIAKTNCTVLIEGESGTGKELFAQSIHNASRRAEGPFIAINCAALPKELVESELFGYDKGSFTGALREGNPGKFELANGGTIFLDEIGEIPLEIQAKLLRVLDNHTIRRIGGKHERSLDVRVIAATNRNLLEEISRKSFRSDLYYRLNVINIKLIPLRERKGDIVKLAEFFLEALNNENPHNPKYLSSSFKEAIEKLEWEGNVREVQNSVQRAYYLCETDCIDDSCLPQKQNEGFMKFKVSYENKNFQQIEKESIISALNVCDGNVIAAAKLLNIGKSTIYRKMGEYGINLSSGSRKVVFQ